MITCEFDTIAAISTPLGEGAIGIVNLSRWVVLPLQKIFKGKDLVGSSHTSTTVTSLTLNW